MTREEAINKLEFLKINLPAAKSEISEIIELLKSPWISVKNDLPCNHKELIGNCPKMTKIVLIKVGMVLITSRMYKYNNENWIWENNEIPDYWMPIPELSKE